MPFHTQNFIFVLIEVETKFCIESHYIDLRVSRLGIFLVGYTSFSVAILAYFKTFLHKESYVFIEIQNS